MAATDGHGCEVRPGHCLHVEELLRQMLEARASLRAAEGRLDALERRRPDERTPLIPPDAPIHTGRDATARPETSRETDKSIPGEKMRLPLVLGPLGGLTTGRLFEDKMTSQDSYKFDGTKGGVAWKDRLERYFISKIPALKVLLDWAERCENPITKSTLKQAIGDAMTDEQMDTMEAAVWGFIANCVSGEALTMFKRAEMLEGMDAWRRLVRFIDHGRGIRLEALRTEIRQITLRPIKSIEHITVGVAEFENKFNEYEEAGGQRPHDDELKADLLAILPDGIRNELLWKSSQPGSFEDFRDMILQQTNKILLNKRRLPVHQVIDDEPLEEPGTLDLSQCTNVEDIIAAVNNYQRRTGRQGTRQGPRPGGGAPARPPQTDRAPRCANCGGEHAKDKCPHPTVPKDKRKCFTCGKEGHTARFCKEKPRDGARRAGGGGAGSIRNVEESDRLPVFGLCAVDYQGFAPARKTARATPTRPQPKQAMFGDFIHKNAFDVLGCTSPDCCTVAGTCRPSKAEAISSNINCKEAFSCIPGSKQFNNLFPEVDKAGSYNKKTKAQQANVNVLT